MKQKKDIQNRADIILLVNQFYERVRSDEQLGLIFDEVACVDWNKHLPRMYDFWENIVFQSGQYTGNPMTAHNRIHQLHPFTREDFAQWLTLFEETVVAEFSGHHAELIVQRARSIAMVMEMKLLHTPPTAHSL